MTTKSNLSLYKRNQRSHLQLANLSIFQILTMDIRVPGGVRKMPAVGMGTSSHPLPAPEVMIAAFLDAVEVGYRHFDTAALYGSEESLGKAVAEAVEKGLVGSRSEFFITSKVWCTDLYPELVVPALKNSLRRLGMDYVDLYLVHFPKDEIMEFDMKGTWNAMEECYRQGLCKAIGLLDYATIPPSVNQVEMNVGWQQKELVELCKQKGVQVCAWSPLSANGAYWGSFSVMKSPVLQEIAEAKGKSVSQVALRWIYEQGVIPIVKSFNKERMKQNLDIFDWELTKDEVSRIEQIPQHRGWSGELFVSETGPYKSADELWYHPFRNL
ncbi:Protein REDOX 2 [Linum perenne]